MDRGSTIQRATIKCNTESHNKVRERERERERDEVNGVKGNFTLRRSGISSLEVTKPIRFGPTDLGSASVITCEV
jgi:hypothetical protein